MRRRRALLHGDNVGSESALSTADKSKATNMEKLKPGKKAKAEQSDMPVAFASVPGSEAPSDVESEAAKEISTKTKGGLTLPYKLKAEFAALGVDAAYLRAQGMDLLHLGVLGRLMGLYASLECGTDGERETDETVSVQSIDAKLIQHLQTAMISFVTDVAHRAIVWKERELRLKKRSRAWRQGEQIAPSAIEHAVNAIGACHHSHKQYFRSLLLFYGLSDHGDTKPRNTSIKYRTASPLAAPSLPAHASDDDHPTGGPADSEAGAEDSDRVAPSPAPFVPHREIYTPLIRPPSACGINPLDCLSQTYMREVTRTQRGGSQDLEEEELISDETDEEELEAELREEDELDRRDMKMAGKLEQCLWDAIGYMDDSDSDILMLELSGTSK
ncbi:hypothetical protein PAXINDRAFT_11763 [Paxillus involutus ATCC 200175]|uniref:Uncharacterized protein n=1 Tax=Paxillus involutus ATCC 200175 TaxID=664439 RepID=A0A0C9SZU2_PAXIN|nr:hypothetical protein PAXINDRAFT_11763 [Paxillus involutus ATCC 200175]